MKLADAGVARGVEGREIDVPHELFGNVGGVVVATAVGGAVAGEVLDAGEHVVGADRLAPWNPRTCARPWRRRGRDLRRRLPRCGPSARRGRCRPWG